MGSNNHRAAALEPDTAWARLAAQPRAQRERAIREHLDSVLALDESARQQAVQRMVLAESHLGPELRTFTASRLSVWAQLLETDLDGVRWLANAYQAALATMPAEFAMRSALTADLVVRNDLQNEELAALISVSPRFVRQVIGNPVELARPDEPATPTRRRPRWKIWP